MKEGLNTSKTYPTQLVVPRASFVSLRLPNYAWIGMVLIAMALLVSAAVYREREGLRAAQASFHQTQQKYLETQLGNEMLRQDLRVLQHDKGVRVQQAQDKLNYVRRNEVVVVVP